MSTETETTSQMTSRMLTFWRLRDQNLKMLYALKIKGVLNASDDQIYAATQTFMIGIGITADELAELAGPSITRVVKANLVQTIVIYLGGFFLGLAIGALAVWFL